jgi:hypothetical protein
MAMPARINYLNNRDLLAEIHRSKLSFCYFVDDKYNSYDVIVPSVDAITAENIEAVKQKRALKATQAQKVKPGEQRTQISPDDIKTEDLVWRVMTFDHIPYDPNRSKNPKTESDKHRKLNFPPFKHYVIQGDTPVEVGRSHWVNGFINGRFCQDQGSINRHLAQMFMTLVERYSQRGNWRGYCVDSMTDALTHHGWKNIDEIDENDMILSYAEGDLKWSKIKSIYRGEFDGLMHKLTITGMDALITPGHKMVTERGLVKAEYLLESDKLVLMGNAVHGSNEQNHCDSLVEICGWILTEGNYDICKEGKMRCITIYQNDGPKADRIRNCLETLNYKFSEGKRGSKQICFRLSRADSKSILDVLPEKNLSMEFILSLTVDQRELLINTMIDGDGWRTGKYRRYCQKDKKHVDLFQALCAISGHRTNTHYKEHIAYGTPSHCYTVNLFSHRSNKAQVESINFHGGKNNGRKYIGKGKIHHPNEPTTYYKGKVWCPETEYGCFLARRNGTVYLTGNTYVSEMRGQALLQLSLVGLQFDEGRSENPFAYFTVVTANAFTRVLNLEKRNQNIRDDILIMNGVTPSITRQLDDQLQQKAQNALDNGDDAIQVPIGVVKPQYNRTMFGRSIKKKY